MEGDNGTTGQREFMSRSVRGASTDKQETLGATGSKRKQQEGRRKPGSILRVYSPTTNLARQESGEEQEVEAVDPDQVT